MAKQKSRSEKHNYSAKQIDKIKKAARAETIIVINELWMTALAEKGWSEEEILETLEYISGCSNHVDNKALGFKDVQGIVQERTGMTLETDWKKKGLVT